VANRTWLAVVLCCGVWFVYERWFAPPLIQKPSVSSSAVVEGNKAPEAALEVKPEAKGIFAVKPTLVDSFRLSNADREVSFSELGGSVKSISLSNFHQTLKSDSPLIQSVDSSTMLHSLGAFFTDGSLSDFGFGRFVGTAKPGSVSFEKTLSGVRLTKQYTPSESGFFIDQNIELTFPEGTKRDFGFLWVPLGGTGLSANHEDPLRSWEAISYQNETVTRKKIEDIAQGSTVLQGATQWIAFGNRYFSTAIVNQSEVNPDVVFEKNEGFTGVYLRFPLVLKEGQKTSAFKLRIFSGPKEYSELSKVPGLKQLIDYGMFSFLAYPLLELLRFFYKFVHNYGLAIILLTLVVRALFYPLSLKSFRSMKGMQALQPQLAALKEKYKDDSAKFAQEQMALFRTHKVNPAGGCLPILVQLPVFIALYAVLQNSIELFHAPFFGWVRDLSSKDPFYVFPVLMGASMFVQQKMTPAVGMDPMQQKIMLLMPVIFSVVMFNLPSGLTAYIFLSTLLGILQQVMMNRERGKTLVPVVTPTSK
jgi:YidC/Oxa1 family membrane protein insertase